MNCLECGKHYVDCQCEKNASDSNSRLIDGLNAETKKNLKFMFGLILASADAAAEELGTSRDIVLKSLMEYIKDTGI